MVLRAARGQVRMNAIYPVILSGGSGTRLWPLSRAMYPKQFVRFYRAQASSFLSSTLQRLPAYAGFAAATSSENNANGSLMEEEPAPSGVPRRPVILEPVARNTAPAIAVAALVV